MTEPEVAVIETKQPVSKLALLAILFTLVGLADSVYLTVHHYTAEPVPCSITEGCEMVLTSQYATIGDIPLAIFGAIAYFVAFSLCLLTAFGDRRMWKLFGVQITLMAVFTGWLLYVQAFLIHAFCQFCLLSAITSLTLFLIYIASIFVKRRA